MKTRTAIIVASCILVVVLGIKFPFLSAYDSLIAKKLCRPFEVHLAFGNSPEEMVVSWRTLSSKCEPSVNYWLASNPNVTDTVNGTTYMITEDMMCGPPANSRPFEVVMHKATLKTKVDDALYLYRIGTDPNRSFRSAKLHSSKKSFTFMAYADMGEGILKKTDREAVDTVHFMQSYRHSQAVDFVAHVGDIAYADGKFPVWDSFMRLIEPTASQVPYMVAVGNHEYDYLTGGERDRSGAKHFMPSWGNFDLDDSGGECGVMTMNRFVMPRASADENPPFWYSFEYGPAHFVVISTEHEVAPGSQQYVWLEGHLAAVDRCRTPWLILLHHRPMYVVYPHKDNRIVGKHIKADLEELYETYNVDLTISGHVHSYFRTCSVYKDKCDPVKGIPHIVVGTGGHILSLIKGKQEPWVESGIMQWGFGSFNITGNQLHVQFLIDINGTVADEVFITTKSATRNITCL